MRGDHDLNCTDKKQQQQSLCIAQQSKYDACYAWRDNLVNKQLLSNHPKIKSVCANKL